MEQEESQIPLPSPCSAAACTHSPPNPGPDFAEEMFIRNNPSAVCNSHPVCDKSCFRSSFKAASVGAFRTGLENKHIRVMQPQLGNIILTSWIFKIYMIWILHPEELLVLCRFILRGISPVQINLSRLKIVSTWSSNVGRWSESAVVDSFLCCNQHGIIISNKSDFTQCSHSHLLLHDGNFSLDSSILFMFIQFRWPKISE